MSAPRGVVLDEPDSGVYLVVVLGVEADDGGVALVHCEGEGEEEGNVKDLRHLTRIIIMIKGDKREGEIGGKGRRNIGFRGISQII